uniref:Nurim n=2 Tax=Callorhinchus milii TaxID=7868 RepID=V9L6F6_CALMI
MPPLGLAAQAAFSLLSFCLVFSCAANFISFVSLRPLQREKPRPETGDAGHYGWSSILQDTRVVEPLSLDLILLGLFILQHSVMATVTVRKWTSAWFGVLQRSVYVLCTAAALQVLMMYWQPVLEGPELWSVRTEPWNSWVVLTCFIIHVIAWLIIISIALIYDYAELMGVKQVYYHCLSLGDPMALKSQKAQRLYCHLRHPVFLEFLLVLWVVPALTLDRLLLAAVLSLYLVFGHSLDQQDYRYLRAQLAKKFEIFSREETFSDPMALNGSR